MAKIYRGVFHNDFTNYKISKTGKTITVGDALSPNTETFRIKDAGTEWARFCAHGWDGSVVEYYLTDFAGA